VPDGTALSPVGVAYKSPSFSNRIVCAASRMVTHSPMGISVATRRSTRLSLFSSVRSIWQPHRTPHNATSGERGGEAGRDCGSLGVPQSMASSACWHTRWRTYSDTSVANRNVGVRHGATGNGPITMDESQTFAAYVYM
jgi:hypothetical protein